MMMDGATASMTKYFTQSDGEIIIPGRFDVILGRGKPLQQHLGNVQFNLLIEENLDRYSSAPGEKFTELSSNRSSIAMEIIQQVKSRGGRFLKRQDGNSGRWIEQDDDVCIEKVRHAFRNRRPQPRSTQQNRKKKRVDV